MGEIHQLCVLPSLLTAQGGDEAGSPGNKEMERERGNLGWWGWRRRRSSRKVALRQEDLQGQRPLITEESGPHLVLIQPWEEEKHVRKMKVAF